MRSLLLAATGLALIFTPALAGEKIPVPKRKPLEARVEGNLRAGTERSIAMTEFWVPLAQDTAGQSVLYSDIRFMGDDQDNREFNLGLGYRSLQSIPVLGDGVFGLNGWLDRRRTERGNNFNQVTAGAEWLGEKWDLRGNAYFPLNKDHKFSAANPGGTGGGFVGNQLVVNTNQIVAEEALKGLDLELGWKIDFADKYTDSTRVYAGGYHFAGDRAEDITGWRARVVSDITSDFQLGARLQHDDVRGSQGFLEATIRFPFGHKKSYRQDSLYARLDESPERDIDIVSSNAVIENGVQVPVVNTQTGQNQRVVHVDNAAAGSANQGTKENPFTTLAAAEAGLQDNDILYIHRGAGTAGMNAGITINRQNIMMIGSGADLIYDQSRFSTSNGSSSNAMMIIPKTSNPVLTNTAGNGVTVLGNNAYLTGFTVDGATGDGILVRADNSSMGNVFIDNVSTLNNRIGIYLHGLNSGSMSAMVQNSAAASNRQHGIAVYDDTSGSFEVDLGGGSQGSAGNNILAGNSMEDLAVDYDGLSLSAKNNWWGFASGPDLDDPSDGQKPQIYFGAPINDGLAGHWTFDTAWVNGATGYDRSGNNNNGTRQGASAFLPDGQLQTGTGGKYFRVPASASLNFVQNDAAMIGTFTPDMDVAAMASAYPILIIKRPYNVGGYAAHFVKATSVLNAQFCSTGPCPSANTSPIMGNTTYNYAGIIDTTQTRLYLNGTQRAVANYAVTMGPHAGNALEIGADFEGKINEIRIYNRALTLGEVEEIDRENRSSIVDTSSFRTSSP